MRPRSTRLVPVVAGLVPLAGCSFGPRVETYEVDIRNGTGRPVHMELLRMDGAAADRIETELGDGGAFTGRFTSVATRGFVEARFRFADDEPGGPMYIFDVDRCRRGHDVVVEEGRLALRRR